MLGEWLRYEDEYGELIQWMKNTESAMKAESDLKASLEEKTNQYERQNVSIHSSFALTICEFLYSNASHTVIFKNRAMQILIRMTNLT